ncbi:unnamed protein product, partial [Sphacelaria rigidula]
LIENPAWGPPPAGDEATRGGDDVTARMLRESLRLCHLLLRLAAATSTTTNSRNGSGPQSSPSATTTPQQELLQMSSVLVAGTIGSASPRVD